MIGTRNGGENGQTANNERDQSINKMRRIHLELSSTMCVGRIHQAMACVLHAAEHSGAVGGGPTVEVGLFQCQCLCGR